MYNELIIPPIGLGTLHLCGKDCISIIKKALELGYRHIDTAPVYHNHHDIRQGIANFDRQMKICYCLMGLINKRFCITRWADFDY